MKPTTEITRRILAIFEPIILPTDRSAELFKTASIETNNSDIDVPNPTMMSPMKNSDILNFLPKLTELETSISAPFIARYKPDKSLNISKGI